MNTLNLKRFVLCSSMFAASFTGICLASQAAIGQTSTGIVVESVDDYGGVGDLTNSIANGDGFVAGMVFPGSRFFLDQNWKNRLVYDTDFVDRDMSSVGLDSSYFDRPGMAISYFTGHGIVAHGCGTQTCSSTAQCTAPVVGARLPGTCRFSPFDSPRCCYMVDRAAVVMGNQDRFQGVVNYTGGLIRWGESPQSGGWAGAGTDGGTNVVVLDISHGILPTFWNQTMRSANAGVQLIATLMTAGGDTANVASRGSTLAAFYRANENNRFSSSWKDTMNALPATLGSKCGNLGGGHGFNGCGCNAIIGMDNTLERAQQSMQEGWVHITNDRNDALGNNSSWIEWQCNYTLPATDHTAWELP